MKSLVGRRIILIMSIAIVSTSILIAGLGFYLSEGIFSFLRGQELVPDLNVLGQVTAKYLEGGLDEDTYIDILAGSEDGNLYMVFDRNMTIIHRSEGFYEEASNEVNRTLDNVQNGQRIFERLTLEDEVMVELAGIPIKSGGQVVGAAYVTTELIALTELKRSFLRSLFLAMIIVMTFVILITNYSLRQIIKPIRNVMKVALAMVEGDFDIRADESMIGEIGLVGRTLNTLSLQLYRNVSQLYIEKNRLDQVLNSLEEGMIAVDDTMKMTHINDVMIGMFDIADISNGSFDIEDIPLIMDQKDSLQRVLDEKKSMDVKAVVGDTVYRIMAEAIDDEHGRVVGAVILCRDITEMENLETTRKNYVANVSHELRSPLTSVRGLIEPLMDGIVKDESDRQRYYGIIYQESLRLSRLVDDIMELSRLQTSDTIIEKTNTSLRPVLEMVTERYGHIDETIELVYEDQPLPEVYTNEDRIEQVLIILLDNAFKFTEPGGQICIKAREVKDHIEVSVSDTGVGISKADLPHIFQRFYKSDKSRTKKSTGLGLSIAREIMEIMGETIKCQSRVGIGTIFTFTVGKH